MTTLAEQILAVLCKIAPEVEPGGVDRSRPLADQLDLDSIDYQTLLATLSTQHTVEIRAVDVPTLRSIDDLVSYIETHRGPR